MRARRKKPSEDGTGIVAVVPSAEKVAPRTAFGTRFVTVSPASTARMPLIFVRSTAAPPAVALATKVSPALPRCVHLMLQHPERYLEDYAKAGATTIQVHAESSCDVAAALRRVRELGCRAGLVLNPLTPAAAALRHLPLVDEILVMTVYPGFGGQRFMREPLPTIRALRDAAPALPIMVDGGVSRDTVALAASAGADCFVAGSALYGAADMAAEIALLRRLADEAAR